MSWKGKHHKYEEKEASATWQENWTTGQCEQDWWNSASGESGRFAIYQMNTRWRAHTYQFMVSESAKIRLYHWGERLQDGAWRAAPWTPTITLEGIFERFNINRPGIDFHGHSLSVRWRHSYKPTAETKAYYGFFSAEELPTLYS